MHCKDGRALELSVVVTVAPGFLASYTKIVRILPRYVVVNTLPYPVRIWQDSSIFRPLSADITGTQDRASKWRYSKESGRRSQSKVNQYEALWGRETRLDEREAGRMLEGTTAHGSALYITTVFPSEIIPFSLPDSRGERLLRVDIGSPWSLTASISADILGDYTMKINRAVDLRILPHVSTRSNPQYEVRLPPSGDSTFDGELGVWFETEWGTSRSLIVNAVKKNSYAFNETDVHVGDELLAMDGIPVSGMTFAEAMGMLRSRLSCIPSKNRNDIPRRRFIVRTRSGQDISTGELACDVKPFVLTFRTVEERLRKVRLKAAKASGERRRTKVDMMIDQPKSPHATLSALAATHKTNLYIQAELKPLPRSYMGTCLVLRDEPALPFEIQNQSIKSTIYYRQRGCNQHAWQSLKPGQSHFYCWDEPLKPKRLTVRVASDSAFHFADDVPGKVLPDSISSRTRATDPDHRGRRRPFRNLKDEEDAMFSPSISIRLEEIGYQEFLALHSTGPKKEHQKSSLKYLKFEVDVEGGTRVLVVNDVSGEDGEQQMTRYLESLRGKVNEVEKRLKELRLLNLFLAPSDDSRVGEEEKHRVAESAKKLMEDFSDETTVTGHHQIVVEVLEAIGLSPTSFIGSCNPYAEVRLKSGSLSRMSLFRKKDVRRTYFVRKTVNPTWHAQSFVFDVPCEAVAVTRGYSIQVRVRNFRVLGNHHTLGKAQVDLHCCRDQEPLVGWFPLAGRTGRRELENQLSHWGRGSVKLRVQWIYSTPALVQYFILLSERRLVELRESLEGMAQQLAKKMDTEAKKNAGRDGFKAVRVRELLSFTKTNMKMRAAHMQKAKRLNNSAAKRCIEPLRPLSDRSFKKSTGQHASLEELTTEEPPSDQTKSISFVSPGVIDGMRKRVNSSNDVVQKLEDRIYLQRLNFHRLTSSRCRVDQEPSTRRDGVFSVSSFKLWASAQAVFNDAEFETQLNGDEIKILLRRAEPTAPEKEVTMRSKCQDIVAYKLGMPAVAPSLMEAASDSYIAEFLRSRGSFERAARISLKSVLHPGGWLSIRPITALNLPDMYTGMFVKVRYGSAILVSETADAKVLDPTWYKPDPRAEEDDQEDILSRNDLLIHVAPQKTSGSIQVSIIGERSHQQLLAKTELGVLHLPLGATIAACMDCAESGDSSPMYVRWFPLTSPKDAVQVEGDGGLSTRPPDSEKLFDNLFHEYFAPTLKLALVWSPDIDDKENDIENNADDESHSLSIIGRNSSAANEALNQHKTLSPMVRNYFSADIGRISVALIDSQRTCELLSLSVHDIDVRYWVTSAKTRVGVTVGWLQLDYQDDNVREPVVLAPTPTDVLGPVLQTLAVKDNIRSVTDIVSFDFIDVSIAEFDFTIEERLVFDLFGFFDSVSHRKGARVRARAGWESEEVGGAIYEHRSLMKTSTANDDLNLLSLLARDVNEESDKRKIYIKQLLLGVVKVNLSYLKGKKSPWEVTRQGGLVEKRFDQVLSFAGGEYLIEQLFFHGENSDVFVAWSQHTSEDELRAEDESKGLFANALCAGFDSFLISRPCETQEKYFRIFHRYSLLCFRMFPTPPYDFPGKH
jgi:C2 domain/SHR-binding domain of vacuolar-sorting associated protein 13